MRIRIAYFAIRKTLNLVINWKKNWEIKLKNFSKMKKTFILNKTKRKTFGLSKKTNRI